MTYKQLSALTRDEARASELASHITAMRCDLIDVAPFSAEARDLEIAIAISRAELAELRGVIARADSDDEWRDRA